jgi:hypothetical protein
LVGGEREKVRKRLLVNKGKRKCSEKTRVEEEEQDP